MATDYTDKLEAADDSVVPLRPHVQELRVDGLRSSSLGVTPPIEMAKDPVVCLRCWFGMSAITKE